MSTNWITLSQTAGTGNQVVTVSAATNEVMSERNLRIKVTIGDKTEYVFVSQEAAPLMVTRIEFTGASLPPISYTGGTLTASDGRYNITAYYSDGSVVPQVPATVTGSFSSNTVNFSFSNVSAGTMNLTASFSGRSASTVYTVMQEPMTISSDEVLYFADEQAYVRNSSEIVSHTFNNGLGVIKFAEPLGRIWGNIGDYNDEYGKVEKICLPHSITIHDVPDIITRNSFNCKYMNDIYFDGTMEEWNNLQKSEYSSGSWDFYGTFESIHCKDGEVPIGRVFFDGDGLPVNSQDSFLNGNSGEPNADNIMNGGGSMDYNNQIVIYNSNFTGLKYGVNPSTAQQRNYFHGKSGITSVKLCNTIKSIGSHTFGGCRDLVHINLDNVDYFGNGAFAGCGFSSFTINSGITFGYDSSSYDKHQETFANCPNLEKVVINSKYSGGYGDCPILSSVTISENTDYIDNYAFQGCTNLNSIVLPNNVKEIGTYAFEYCTSLTSITIGDYIEKVKQYAFDDTPWYNSHSGDTYMTIGKILYKVNNLPRGTSISLSMPTYYCIADYALKNTKIGSADINVPYIGDYAFNNCTSLTSVTFGNLVKKIGKSAFKSCSGITSVSFENGLISIEDEAFYECKGLTSLVIPNSATSIGNNAFEYCTSLTSITIPNTVTSMGGNGTFWGCNSLVSVVLPPVIENVDFTYTFYECNNLVSVTVPYGVTGLGENVFNGCSNLSYVSLPETINKIANGNFSGCNNLQSITFTGTKAQWNNITKTSGWKNNSAISVIHCTDGDISV